MYAGETAPEPPPLMIVPLAEVSISVFDEKGKVILPFKADSGRFGSNW